MPLPLRVPRSGGRAVAEVKLPPLLKAGEPPWKTLGGDSIPPVAGGLGCVVLLLLMEALLLSSSPIPPSEEERLAMGCGGIGWGGGGGSMGGSGRAGGGVGVI